MATTTKKMATLYGPNGAKEAVEVGSSRASYLQSQGWGLTAGSYKPVSSPTKTVSKATTVSSAKEPTGAAVKTNKTDVVNTFRRNIGRLPTTQQDWDTVYFLMTKSPTEVESRLASSVQQPTTRTTTTSKDNTQYRIDPIKIAMKYGYTEADFKNDPNFVKYWGGKSEQELVSALQKRGDFSSIDGRKRTADEQEGFSSFKDELDRRVASGELTKEEASAALYAYENADSSGKKIYTEEEYKKLASEAENAARGELADYYKDVQRRDMEDLRNEYADIRNEALRYKQQDEKSYRETLDETKKSLRARGMTFSGTSRKTIGAEGALAAEGVEGELPQQRRYNWEDKRATWQETARDLGTSAERLYGSDTLYAERDYLNPEGLPDPYGGGITYDPNKKQSIYLPHKDPSQDGYVSKTQADREKEKEAEVQKRAAARMANYQYA